MENMGEKEILEKLERKGVKPTANRILVLKALLSNSTPVSLSDLEDFIVTMDKSSIFRVLTLFLEHNVVHAMEDGSGSLKYEVCVKADALFPICISIFIAKCVTGHIVLRRYTFR